MTDTTKCPTQMRHVQQSPGSSLCGQCVVSMLSNAALEEVISLMGEGRTYPANMRKALRHFGVNIPSRSQVGSIEAPAGRGAAMLWGRQQHWVAWHDGAWFDPAKMHLLSDLGGYEVDAIAIYPVQEAT